MLTSVVVYPYLSDNFCERVSDQSKRLKVTWYLWSWMQDMLLLHSLPGSLGL